MGFRVIQALAGRGQRESLGMGSRLRVDLSFLMNCYRSGLAVHFSISGVGLIAIPYPARLPA